MAKKEVLAHVINDSCCNCRLWHRLSDSKQTPAEDVWGECWLHPPKVVDVEEGTGNPLQSRPMVKASEFCGDHRKQVH